MNDTQVFPTTYKPEYGWYEKVRLGAAVALVLAILLLWLVGLPWLYSTLEEDTYYDRGGLMFVAVVILLVVSVALASWAWSLAKTGYFNWEGQQSSRYIASLATVWYELDVPENAAFAARAEDIRVLPGSSLSGQARIASTWHHSTGAEVYDILPTTVTIRKAAGVSTALKGLLPANPAVTAQDPQAG
jgi:hypothetical protein